MATPREKLESLPHYQGEHTIDLDTDKALYEAKNMHKAVIASKNGTGPLIAFPEYYQQRYNYLFTRCPRWFNTIFENTMGDNYMIVLENMLNKIKDIQSKKISQFQADADIGQALHNKYIVPFIDMTKENGAKENTSKENGTTTVDTKVLGKRKRDKE